MDLGFVDEVLKPPSLTSQSHQGVKLEEDKQGLATSLGEKHKVKAVKEGSDFCLSHTFQKDLMTEMRRRDDLDIGTEVEGQALAAFLSDTPRLFQRSSPAALQMLAKNASCFSRQRSQLTRHCLNLEA